jgi:polyisoprenoid-binding protein YceI
MKANGSNLDAGINFNAGTKQLEGIQPLVFNMPVSALKSDEGLLNTRAYDALKKDKYPNFTFKLTSTRVTGNQINIVGQLSICGTTKEVTLPATIQKTNNGLVVLSGTKKIKMTEFGVTPPKYMLGMMRVYDDLTLNYTVRF